MSYHRCSTNMEIMKNKILITGGAGFIGSNSASFFANNGWEVVVLDNLSRQGATLNLEWLNTKHSFVFEKADVCDADQVVRAMRKYNPDVVLHLAAQVAVTNSVVNPREDFEINALGTLNVLEAVRLHCPDTFSLMLRLIKFMAD